MGFFSRMGRIAGIELRGADLNNPSIPLSSDSIISILGTGLTTDSGIHVSEFNALRVAAVWRCVSLIAGTIAQMPLSNYKGVREVDGPRQPGSPKSILHTAPDGLTLYEFKEQIMVHLLLWGNAYIRTVRNNGGDTIVDWILYRPWEVIPSRANPGSPKQYRVVNGPQNLTDDDILHIPGMGYDGIRGLNPIQYQRQGIGLAVAAEEYGARFFGNGAMLGGILKSADRIPQDKAEQLKNRWRDKVIGLARAHEIAVIDSGVEYQALTIPPDTAQFLQTRAYTVTDIARWYGVPPHLVMDVDKTTSWGAGIAEQSLGFVKYTVGFWTSRLEQRFDKVLDPGEFAGFDMDALLRGDALQRSQVWHNAISDGWMNRAEVRVKENEPPAPDEAGLDKFEVSTLETVTAAAVQGALAAVAAANPQTQPQGGDTEGKPLPKAGGDSKAAPTGNAVPST